MQFAYESMVFSIYKSKELHHVAILFNSLQHCMWEVMFIGLEISQVAFLLQR